jgi:acetyltransferase-like isoleucine patch superfamily enzyme
MAARRLQTVVRYLTPQLLSRLYYRWRFGTRISPRAEVAASRHVRFGRGCEVAAYTTIKATGPLEAGDRVRIGPGCLIGAGGPGLRIGDDVEIEAGCTIVTGTYTFARLDLPLHEQPYLERRTEIGRGVVIGANTVVLGGSRIGDGAVVAAGSVVSGEVPAGSVVRGNPARSVAGG